MEGANTESSAAYKFSGTPLVWFGDLSLLECTWGFPPLDLIAIGQRIFRLL